MSNIVFVSQTTSFIISSLIQQLEEQGHSVLKVGSDMSEVERLKELPQVFLIHADENLVVDMKLLVYLKDRIIEEDIPVLMMGDQEQIDAVENVIPRQFVKKRFLRPINVKEVAEAINEYLAQGQSQSKKKILVVDDSGAMLRNVKGWLEDKYQVILANSGTNAIKYLTMKHPDLILLDYEMPVCDGKQVLEMIRSDSEFSSVPVIFLTCRNDRETVMQVSALKPDGYLLKTMEPEQIVKAVDEFFEKKKWTYKN